ncbi:hypothetical protein LguiA_032888 [Lonicera macranthoides]
MIFITVPSPNSLSFWERWFLTWYQRLVLWEVQGSSLDTSIPHPPSIKPTLYVQVWGCTHPCINLSALHVQV